MCVVPSGQEAAGRVGRVEWEIGKLDPVGLNWTVIGSAEGPSPTAALEAWLREEGGAPAGKYGARSLGDDQWHLHRLNLDGFRPIDA